MRGFLPISRLNQHQRRILGWSSPGPFWVFFIVVAIYGCSEAPRPVPDGPDILVVTVDTLRADHLGLYGYARKTSPNIDRWFESSVIFDNAYATETATSPSIASILTGRLPQFHRVRLFYQLLPRGIPTIADVLGEAGYETAAVVSNIVLTDEAIGLADRFDYYDDFVDEPEPQRKIWERNARRTTDAVLDWLRGERDTGRSSFLWVHYIDPHGPYRAPPDRPIQFEHSGFLPLQKGRMLSYQIDPDVIDMLDYVDRYDEEIAYVDREIGRLLDAYAKLGLAKEAVIILTADHGETMVEHEGWFMHGYHVYEGIARVPLAIRVPRRDAARVRRNVSLIDLVPTLLELAGVEVPEAMRDIDGRSLFTDDSAREILVEATSIDGRTQHRAQIEGSIKFVVDIKSGSRSLFRRFRYDLSQDPDEQEQLPWHPEDDRLAAGLLERIAADPDPGGRPRQSGGGMQLSAPKVRPGVSDDELEKLRSLGYVE